MKKWEILKTENIYTDPPLITLDKNSIKTSSGKVIDDYYHISAPDFVMVFAMTADRKVILLRHYRQGIESETLGVASGMINDHETANEAAIRELREETGYSTNHLMEIGKFAVHSNWHISTGYYFIAEAAYLVATPDSQDLEESYVEIFDLADTVDALRSGQFKTMSDALAVSLALQLITPME